MNARYDILYIIMFLSFILALWIGIFFAPLPDNIELFATGGFCDISDADFRETIYKYDGDWESWPESLYAPEDFAAGAVTEEPSFSANYGEVQFFTHRLRISVPIGGILGLYMTSSDYSMRIFIDGLEAGSVGSPGTTRETTVNRVLEKTYFFKPVEETVEIIIHTANFVHGNDGCHPPVFYIGSYENITRFVNAGLSVGFLISGCLISAFIYHLGLFCLNRRKKTVLVFSASCLLLSLMNKKLFFLLFPNYNWFAGIRVEYVVHFLTFVTLVLFVDMLHANMLNKYITRSYHALAGLYLLITFIFDPFVFTRLLVLFEISSILMIAYIVVRLAISFMDGTIKNRLSFAGILVLGLLGINDILYYRGIVLIPPVSGQFFFAPIGMIFFVFCYSMVLSIENAETERAMRKAREAEETLAMENAALDRLNIMKTDLMATISHETRTPLAVMSNYAELIAMGLRSKGVDEQTAADLDKISEEIMRIAGIMERMQKFSRARENISGKEWIQLADLIAQCASLYAPILKRKEIELRLNLPEDAPMIFGNTGELTQVIFNLLQNSRNHTEKGTVTISMSYIDENAEPKIIVSISDTGSGILPEFIPHAFERYAHNNPNGNGLGLSICKEVVESHGGSIEIESAVNRGTIVRFSLPLSEEVDGIGESGFAG